MREHVSGVSVCRTLMGTYLINLRYVNVTLSILQSQFIEKGFKKAENCEQNVVLLLFLFTLKNI